MHSIGLVENRTDSEAEKKLIETDRICQKD
jgi:hypothetical protein